MKRHRMEHVNSSLQEAIATALLVESTDRRLQRVTVTAVETSRDFKHARVFVTVLGDASEREASMEALEHARGFLQAAIAERVRLRYTPQLRFQFDDSVERAHRIEDLLREADKGERDAGEET